MTMLRKGRSTISKGSLDRNLLGPALRVTKCPHRVAGSVLRANLQNETKMGQQPRKTDHASSGHGNITSYLGIRGVSEGVHQTLQGAMVQTGFNSSSNIQSVKVDEVVGRMVRMATTDKGRRPAAARKVGFDVVERVVRLQKCAGVVRRHNINSRLCADMERTGQKSDNAPAISPVLRISTRRRALWDGQDEQAASAAKPK